MTEANRTPQAVLYRLRWPIRLTWAGLLAERVTRAFWPVWSLVFLAIAALALGLQDHLPLEAIWSAMVLWTGGLIWALVSGLRRFRWPRRAEALARLDATLPGRPLAALGDTQAIGMTDDASVAVWRAHLDRMAARAAGARPPQPDLRISRRDPYALRYVALTALVVALLFGSFWRIGEVGDLAGGTSGGALAEGPAWEGWVQPPAYTGKPGLYLNDLKPGPLALPEGSKVILRLYGKVGALSVSETVSARTEDIDPATATAQEFTVARSGDLAIAGPGGREWQIEMIADAAPEVRLLGEISHEASGEMRQSFKAMDDYAVTAGHAEITLDMPAVTRRYGLVVDPEPREPIVIDLPLPFSGKRDDFTEILAEDLSLHPWVGLPVVLTLHVSDARDQSGSSEPLHVALPGRRFFDPLAAALIEVRRDLLWSRANGPRALQILQAVSHRPEGFFRNERAYLQLRVAMRQLQASLTPALDPKARDELAQTLWDIALLVEEGDLASALERLRRSQDRLAEAIRNGANKSEIDALMREMNEALQNYLRQLAEEAQRNPDAQTSQNQEGMELSGNQLQELMDKLQQLMEEGRTAEAEQLLEQLRELMENMQVTLAEGGDGPQTPGQQAMEGLGETLRDQQDLSDDSFQSLQGDSPPQAGGQGGSEQEGRGINDGQQQGSNSENGQNGGSDAGDGSQSGTQGEGAPVEDQRSLAERQQDLRDRLAEQQRMDLPGAGTPEGDAAREALDRAGRAMEDAEQALRDNDMSGALDSQAEAMEALRDSLRSLNRAMAEEQRQNPGGQGEAIGGTSPEGRRDPLGRETGENGGVGTDRAMTQGDDVYRRAREILDELRRRSGEQDRPEIELDYLRRLLERF